MEHTYRVGTSNVSIEPDDSIFSLALAGYGAPREGRFSLTWKYLSAVPQITAIANLDGRLYAVNGNNELLEVNIDRQNVSFKNIGAANDLMAFTGFGGAWYAVNTDHQLVKGTLSQGRVAWQIIDERKYLSTVITFNQILYAISVNGELLKYAYFEGAVVWTVIGRAKQIISLTSDDRFIYALDNENTVWRCNPKIAVTWTKIARHNSFNFAIEIKQITYFNGRFYAISEDNKCYIAEHSSKKDLTARAMAIESQGSTVVIVGVDVTGFNSSFTDDIKNEIYNKRKISASAILINASHTHFAPVTQAWSAWQEFYHKPDSYYLNQVKKGIIKAVENALDELIPAEIYFASGATHIGFNRRSDVNADAVYDNTVDVLKIEYKNQKASDVLFITGCHPVFKNQDDDSPFTLSSNFPGVARNLVQGETGANAIFLQGFAGDINPADDSYEDTGAKLGNDVIAILNNDLTKIEGGISCSLNRINIPVQPWSVTAIQQFKAVNIAGVEKEEKITLPYTPVGQFVLTPLMEREKNVRWANLMLDNYAKGEVPASFPVLVQIINIGNWKLVGLSREIVAEYGDAIRGIWPDKIVSVAAYCNDVSSYVPSDWHINAKTYEGDDSFFWYGQSAVPPVNVRDIVIDGIKKLRNQNL